MLSDKKDMLSDETHCFLYAHICPLIQQICSLGEWICSMMEQICFLYQRISSQVLGTNPCEQNACKKKKIHFYVFQIVKYCFLGDKKKLIFLNLEFFGMYDVEICYI